MAQAGGRVVGYEANGGFLLGFDATLPAGRLAALPTRDSLLPIVAPLSVAHAAGGLVALVAAEPPRFTATDRLEDVATKRAAVFLQLLITDAAYRAMLLNSFAEEAVVTDQTDGLRISCASGNIVHLRPSGNAPEFRVYVEAADRAEAMRLLARVLKSIQAYLIT
jgi:phosphomannomutase